MKQHRISHRAFKLVAVVSQMPKVLRKWVILSLALSLLIGLPVYTSSAQNEDISIDFYYPSQVGGSVTGIMQGYADAFHEANPDITVNIVYTGNYGQTYEAITTEIAGGGEGPHAAILAAVNVYSLIELGLIIPAQDFIDQMENGQEFIDGFFPAFMTPDVDGVYWAVPFQRSTAIFFYNKDMFRAAGLDPEQPPRNRLELLEDAQALTTDQVWGLSMPTEDGWLFQSFTIADGEDIYRGDPTQVYFDTPTAVGALEYIVSLSQEHKVMPAGVVTWGDASGDFLGEKVAMLYYSTGALTNILTNANFEVGVSFLPSGLPGEDGTGYGTPTGGGNIFLFDRGSEQEKTAAWQWAQFLSSPEIQADWGIQTGYIAATTEAWETDQLLEWVDLHPEYGVAREQLAFAQQELDPYQYGDVSKALTDALQSAITGEEAPAAALSRAQRLADSILEAYR